MITSTRKQQNGSNSSRLLAETITNEYIHIESHSIPKSTIMTDSDMCLAQMFFCCFSLYFISFVRLSSAFNREWSGEKGEREKKYSSTSDRPVSRCCRLLNHSSPSHALFSSSTPSILSYSYVGEWNIHGYWLGLLMAIMIDFIVNSTVNVLLLNQITFFACFSRRMWQVKNSMELMWREKSSLDFVYLVQSKETLMEYNVCQMNHTKLTSNCNEFVRPDRQRPEYENVNNDIDEILKKNNNNNNFTFIFHSDGFIRSRFRPILLLLLLFIFPIIHYQWIDKYWWKYVFVVIDTIAHTSTIKTSTPNVHNHSKMIKNKEARHDSLGKYERKIERKKEKNRQQNNKRQPTNVGQQQKKPICKLRFVKMLQKASTTTTTTLSQSFHFSPVRLSSHINFIFMVSLINCKIVSSSVSYLSSRHFTPRPYSCILLQL